MPIDPQLNTELKRLLAANQHEQAAALCREGLTSSPDSPELLTALALSELALGQTEAALASLHQAVAADERHAASRFQLGRLLAARGDSGQARACFEQCLTINPNHAPARTLLARLDASEGNHPGALSGARTALRADPDHMPAMVLMAELALADDQLELAHEQASHAVRLAPDNTAAQMVMARVFERQGHLAFAEQCLNNAIESSPAALEPRRSLAELLARSGRDKDALSMLETLVASHSSDVGLRLALARCKRRLGQLEGALSDYLWLLDDGNEFPELILETAECLFEDGQLLEARTLLVRDRVVDMPASRLLEARINAAEGSRSEARRQLMELAECDDSDVAERARLLGADLAMQDGEPEEALAVLTAAGDDVPSSPETLWSAIRIHRQLGNDEALLRSLEAAIQHPRSPDRLKQQARQLLADRLDRRGNYQAAGKQLSDCGWRPPVLPEGSATRLLDELADGGFGRTNEDGRVDPVWVAGWPGGGRELVLSALASSSSVRLQPPSQWPQRRDQLMSSIQPGGVPTESALRLARRRYLRSETGPSTGQPVLLEPGVVFAAELVALARVFPNAYVIHARADLPDLLLNWRLAGYGDIERMQAAWENEQMMLERLEKALPLRWTTLDLSAWSRTDGPGASSEDSSGAPPALKALCEMLELECTEAMVEAVDKAVEQSGLRMAGHYRHYADD